MVVKKKGEKWYVVKKNGSLGKRGYATQQNAVNAQRNARKLTKKTGRSTKKKSSKSSTKRSNPAGGARTSFRMKIGGIFKKLRTIVNFGAPPVGAWHPFNRSSETTVNLKRALRRSTGIYLGEPPSDLFVWEPEYAIPAWQGWTISGINDWFDRKTGTARKISQGKIVHILKEAIPVLDAHENASGMGSLYSWYFYRRYNKLTTGYDLQAHNWDGGRITTYASLKGLAWLYDQLVPQSLKSTLNSYFPKKINPF